MKNFLLVTCAFALFLTGCGQSPGDQNKTEAKPAKNVSRLDAPKVESAAEVAEATRPAPQQTVEQSAAPVKKAAPPVSEQKPVTEEADAIEKDKGSDTVADVIEMKNTAAFEKHSRTIVMFSHKKHSSLSPDGYAIACGECHHDKNGQPLELTPGDFVQSCIACHDKTEKPGKPSGMSREEWSTMQLEYYYGAIHANCIDCHKEGGAGPTKCNECHPRPEK